MEHKSQHYVPRSYLAGFVDPETPEHYEPYVWVHERKGDEPYQKAPKNVAEDSFYYSFRNERGELQHDVEAALSKIEGPGVEVIRTLDQGTDPEDLTEEQRTGLAVFLGFMAGRVPARRDHIERQLGEFGQRLMQFAASRRGYFHRIFREAMAESGREFDEDEVEKHRQRILEGEIVELRGTPETSLRLMIELAPLEGEYARQFPLRVLEVPESARFFTSDNPLVKVSTERLPAPWGWGVGWETPWMEATFPLSPSACLLISQHHPPGREVVSTNRVREINFRTAAHAGADIYSSVERSGQDVFSRPSDWTWWTPATDASWEECSTEREDRDRPDD